MAENLPLPKHIRYICRYIFSVEDIRGLITSKISSSSLPQDMAEETQKAKAATNAQNAAALIQRQGFEREFEEDNGRPRPMLKVFVESVLLR